MKKTLLITGISASLLLSGCSNNVRTETDFSRQGNTTRHEVTNNNRVISRLHQVMDGVIVEGRGIFKHANQAVARNMAINLAINDLAKQAGEVLSEEDTTLYNEQVRMVIRTRARNIVQGYSVIQDTYDPVTKTAEVMIRQEGERIASRIEEQMQ